MFFKKHQLFWLCIIEFAGSCLSRHHALHIKEQQAQNSAPEVDERHIVDLDIPCMVTTSSTALEEKDENYTVQSNCNRKDFENLLYEIAFSLEGKNYEATFRSNRLGTIQLFEKVGSDKNLLPMPEPLANFHMDGGKHIIQYLRHLEKTSKFVTPLLNIYKSPSLETWDDASRNPENIFFQRHNVYITEKASDFSTYFTAFKNGELKFLIIPLHTNSVYQEEPLEAKKNEEMKGHLDFGILFKDVQGNIQLTIVDTTALASSELCILNNDEEYKKVIKNIVSNNFARINIIHTLLSSENNLSDSKLISSHYEISDEGLCRKKGVNDVPIHKIGFAYTKQFGARGCTITTLKNINDLLLQAKVPNALHTICRQDYQEKSNFRKLTYKIGPYECQVLGDECDKIAKTINRNRIIKDERISAYELSHQATTSGDAVKEAMMRIMLYLKYPSYGSM